MRIFRLKKLFLLKEIILKVKANIDRQHINRWVNPNSNRGISIYSLNKFCKTLGISLKYFFDSPLFEEK